MALFIFLIFQLSLLTTFGFSPFVKHSKAECRRKACLPTFSFMSSADICLKEVTSIADSLYNIQLLKEFANEYLNKCFYLTLEDMLYAPPVLKVCYSLCVWSGSWFSFGYFCDSHIFEFVLQHNVMVFIAELFWWFEIVKPEFVQPRDIQEFEDGKEVSDGYTLRFSNKPWSVSFCIDDLSYVLTFSFQQEQWHSPRAPGLLCPSPTPPNGAFWCLLVGRIPLFLSRTARKFVTGTSCILKNLSLCKCFTVCLFLCLSM